MAKRAEVEFAKARKLDDKLVQAVDKCMSQYESALELYQSYDDLLNEGSPPQELEDKQEIKTHMSHIFRRRLQIKQMLELLNTGVQPEPLKRSPPQASGKIPLYRRFRPGLFRTNGAVKEAVEEQSEEDTVFDKAFNPEDDPPEKPFLDL